MVNCPGSQGCFGDVIDTIALAHTAPTCLGANENQMFTQAFSATIGAGTAAISYPLTIQNSVAMGSFNSTLKVDVNIAKQ